MNRRRYIRFPDGRLIPIEDRAVRQESRREVRIIPVTDGKEEVGKERLVHDTLVEMEGRWKQAERELEETRKRFERELERTRRLERERALGDWLQVVDNLERALDERHGLSREVLTEGIRAIYNQCLDILERHGVDRMAVLERPFDPTCHEAVAVTPGEKEGVVVRELSPGYVIEGDILRPARVVVSRVERRDGI